ELIDSLLGAVNQSSGTDETLVVLLSPRGFPLGEHRRVGSCDDALYAELTHVPLMMRLPEQIGGANRTRWLIQPADLSATILDCCGLADGVQSAVSKSADTIRAGEGRSILPSLNGEAAAPFDRACVVAADEQVFVSPAWSLRLPGEAETAGEGRAGSASGIE